MCEDNTYNVSSAIVRADLTLSLQLPKLAFLFAENEAYVGEWRLLDIRLSAEAIAHTPTDYETDGTRHRVGPAETPRTFCP